MHGGCTAKKIAVQPYMFLITNKIITNKVVTNKLVSFFNAVYFRFSKPPKNCQKRRIMLILYNIFEKKYCVTKKICNFTFVLWINVRYQQN